ncbi:MAG: acetylglutamate kinase [Actinobacteria bacterium]|nr:acetylglutamate kinase [Actinomycetota bacterium]
MSRIVVKVGGAVAGSSAAAILELTAMGHEVCVVHGAGPQISREMERFGLEVEFVDGRRVTTRVALSLVRASLARVNEELCAALGPPAVGHSGDEIGLHAVPMPALGLVGDPLPCRPPAVEATLAAGKIPVVAPLGVGPLNVNADEAAAALAVGLGAVTLLFFTDVPGLLLEEGVVGRIGAEEAERLLGAGVLEGGIVPKLHAAVSAAKLGVEARIGETVVVA